MFEKSILIVAHPDDEALWFSSILNQVDEVILCFLDIGSQPEWTKGRQKSISAHPISNITCLGIKESEVFDGADWQQPVVTKYGIEISKRECSDKTYKNNYEELKQQLENKLAGYQNIFTHNPWGEYGHEEHVQVYRVLKELQNNMQYNLWFSNYCSNKSFNLMLAYVSGFNSEYVTLNTDKILGSRLKNLYKKNNCWTWYDNYEWFNNESFMLAQEFQNEVSAYGHIFPLNLIKMESSVGHNRSSETQQTLLRRMFRKIRSSQ